MVLDMISESLKMESVERYIRDVFDTHIAPNDWDRKVEIIRQFINRCGMHISSSVREEQPERYAQNYQDLIRIFVNSLKETSSVFRRF